MNQGKRRILSLAVMIACFGLLGCGGGGSSSNGGTLPQTSAPPTVTLDSWAPADAQLVQYKTYTFIASGADSNIGGSIAEFQWDFGDGSKTVTAAVLANGKATATTTHAYTAGSAQTLKVVAKNGAGLLSAAASHAFTVIVAPSPLTAAFTEPTGPVTVNAPLNGSGSVTFKVQVTNSGTGSILPAGVVLDPGDVGATLAVPQDLGNGVWSVVATYPAAATVGSRSASPTVKVVDSNGLSSDPASGPVVTVKTISLLNNPPVITVTDPATPTSSAFTSKPITLGFTLKDGDSDPVTYTVNWGDGTVATVATPTGDFLAGVPVSLNHAYADAFTASTRSATITVDATDNRSSTAQAVQQTRTFTVAFNVLPTAVITSPQDSGAAPTGYSSSTLPADTVVVPLNGKLTFAGLSSKPGSQDATTSSWTFPGGVPSFFAGDAPGDVIFAGTAGVITSNTVTYTVADPFGRTATRQKTVLVDGVNTQLFNLSFQYRQKSDNNGVTVLAPVSASVNGLGASVQIFQDGQSNSYKIQNQTQIVGAKAIVAIPVRSDLPFYIKVPGFGIDATTYLMRIPNAPTGAFADPSLEATPSANSRFSFQNSSAPFNPTLQIVTAQGFAAESTVAPQRKLDGLTDLVIGASPNPANERWLDRLSVPTDDPLGAFQWSQGWNGVASLSGIPAYQLFAEWPTLILTRKTGDLAETIADTTSAAGKSSDLGFVLDYTKYQAFPPKSETFSAFSMQIFRVPSSVNDPYHMSPAWQVQFDPAHPADSFTEYNDTYSSPHAGLNPLPIAGGTSTFLNNLINANPGSIPLAGGIRQIPLPYDPNIPDRTPLSLAVVASSQPRTYSGIKSVFTYSEYLWSTVWARPLVLNSARPDYTYSTDGLSNPGAFPWFRYSNPIAWPKASGISPDNSAFDLTVRGGGFFNALAPVTVGGGTPLATGVGRFFWTAFTPSYTGDGNQGAVISRTWLADDATKQLPTAFSSASATGDATATFGLMTPQDTIVDKRGRTSTGALTGSSLGGYRVTWYNPTKDANENAVAPDFWVVELADGTSKTHFLLPGNYPATTQSTSDLILTDARVYLPSGNAPTAGPAVGDKVGPGYCWFDIPLELRPSSANGFTLTVFGVKSVLKNNPASGARALNRPDWMDAIKTATATIKVQASSGSDLSYAHKIPFNYYWDIVVVNGPATFIAP